MYLLLSIILASFLGLLLYELDAFIGGITAFGIVVGCLFRGIYLLNDIRERLSEVVVRSDKVDEASDKDIEDNEKISKG